MYKSTNLQTREVRRGTWDELCDLDVRQWRLERDVVKSHSEMVEKIITRVYTKAWAEDYGIVTMWLPLVSEKQLRRKEVLNEASSTRPPLRAELMQ